jgi:O-antigen ligase
MIQMTMGLLSRRFPDRRKFASGLLALGVHAYALSLLMGRGTYEPALIICAVAVAPRVLDPEGRSRLRGPLIWVLLAGVAFLVPGIWMASRPIGGDFHWALASCLLATTAIVMLPLGPDARPNPSTAAAFMMMVFVAFHLAGNAWGVQENKVGWAGGFNNIHYMALFAVMSMPLLIYLTLGAGGRVRRLLAGALAADFWLLMQSHSRPGYLALIATALVFLLFVAPRRRWLGALALLLLLSGVYASGLFEFSARINDFLTHLDQEERAVIWREFLRLQENSTPAQWLFGHGLGQYFMDYQAISSFHDLPHGLNRDFSSPHNFFLEVLYSCGVWGLLVFLSGYLAWFRAVIQAIRANQIPEWRGLGLMLLSVMTAQLTMCFFTIPFFSRHHLHPLSLILGASLAYLQQGRNHE